MNRIVLFVIFALLGVGGYAQRPNFLLEDGTQLLYWVDSIYITKYTIVKSGINKHRFLIPADNYQVGKKNVKFWNDTTAMIFLEDNSQVWNFCAWPRNLEKTETQWSEIWPWDDDERQKQFGYFRNPDNLNDTICSYIDGARPTFFRIFKIRGDAYNNMMNAFDVDYSRIKFRRRKKYYWLCIPIR